MKTHTYALILLLLIGVISACASIGQQATPTPPPTNTTAPTSTHAPTSTPTEIPTATATPTQTVTPTPEPEIYIQEDFSSAGESGFQMDYTNGIHDGEVVDGHFRMFNGDPEYYESQATYYEKLADFAVSVDVQFYSDASGYGYAGLIFRQGQNRSAYDFTIMLDGTFTVGKYDGHEEYTPLINSRHSQAIRPGAEPNQLAVLAEGSHLTFFINGERVGEVEDEDYKEGEFGLIVGTGDPTGTVVDFDNFLVTNPIAWHAQPPPLPEQASAPVEYEVVFEDDFASKANQWTEYTIAEGEASYRNEQLVMRTFLTGTIYSAPAIEVVSDFELEFDAQVTNDPGNDVLFGAYFRGMDIQNIYVFEVALDGTFIFGEIIGGKVYIIENDVVEGVVLPLNEVNHVMIKVEGTHFIFSINGETVLEAESITFRTGYIAAILESVAQASDRVAFDNFVVRAATGQ